MTIQLGLKPKRRHANAEPPRPSGVNRRISLIRPNSPSRLSFINVVCEFDAVADQSEAPCIRWLEAIERSAAEWTSRGVFGVGLTVRFNDLPVRLRNRDLSAAVERTLPEPAPLPAAQL
jgi:hypothetical protein